MTKTRTDFVYEMRAATDADAVDLAKRVRQADKDELWASNNVGPLMALRASMGFSRAPMVGTVDGLVICMFGVAGGTIISNVGVPWMISSNELPQHAFAFLAGSQEVIKNMLAEFGYLRNFVDARNTHAIRWLKWLGFTIHPAVTHGVEQIPFHPFEYTRN